MEVVASQYRKLALLLNPGKNRLSFADQAFRLVSEAWNVLSNPSKKAIYDNELRFLQFGHLSQLGQQQQQQQQQPHHHQYQHQQQQQFQQPQTQSLFMQAPPPPPPQPKETQSLFMQTPLREAPAQVTQPLFVRRSPRNNSNDRDGNAALEGGQLGLNNNQPEPTRPTESSWRHINQIGLAGPSQINQLGSVGSSQISRPEPTRTTQLSRPEPTRTPPQVSRPEPMRTTQINQTGTASSSQVNRSEPSPTGPVNQTATPPPPPPTEPTRPSQATESAEPTFWTACPYCYNLYEYPKTYEDCSLRCQSKKCRRAFHAVVIPSPPVNDGKDTYFCSWGYFPLGFSGNGKNMGGNSSGWWSPISTMFACPTEKKKKSSAPRVFYDEHDVYVEISDSDESVDDDDDDEWQNEKRNKKKAKNSNSKGKGPVGRPPKKTQSERVKKGTTTNGQVNVVQGGNLSTASNVPEGRRIAESSRRGVGNSGRKQMGRGAKDLGKLDLNVEFSNEVEEPAPRRSEGSDPGYGEEDNIEGNGFFEGLDEFLSSLPILSVVGDDKVKAT